MKKINAISVSFLTFMICKNLKQVLHNNQESLSKHLKNKNTFKLHIADKIELVVLFLSS